MRWSVHSSHQVVHPWWSIFWWKTMDAVRSSCADEKVETTGLVTEFPFPLFQAKLEPFNGAFVEVRARVNAAHLAIASLVSILHNLLGMGPRKRIYYVVWDITFVDQEASEWLRCVFINNRDITRRTASISGEENNNNKRIVLCATVILRHHIISV